MQSTVLISAAAAAASWIFCLFRVTGEDSINVVEAKEAEGTVLKPQANMAPPISIHCIYVIKNIQNPNIWQ